MTRRDNLESIAIHSAHFFEMATREGLPARINANPELAPLKSSLSSLGGLLMKWGLVTKANGRFVSVPEAAAKLNDDAAESILAAFARTAEPMTSPAIGILGGDGRDLIDAVEKARPFLSELPPSKGNEAPKARTGLFRTERFITRDMLKANPDTLFVFGDNLARQGFGGQAKEMRGEPNAVGIPTKKAPRRDEAAYFTDADFEIAAKAMEKDLNRLKAHIAKGGDIVFPTDGIGTGLAELSRRAPKIDAHIQAQIQNIKALSREAAPVRPGADLRANPDAHPVEVLNKRMLPRGTPPADIIDISRFGTLRFEGDIKPTLGNPFVMNEYRGHDGSREDVVRKYASKLAADFERPGFKDWFSKVTEGKKGVVCFCAPELCHGFVTKAAIEAIRSGRDPREAIRPFETDPTAARAAQEKQSTQSIPSPSEAPGRDTADHCTNSSHQRIRQPGFSR